MARQKHPTRHLNGGRAAAAQAWFGEWARIGEDRAHVHLQLAPVALAILGLQRATHPGKGMPDLMKPPAVSKDEN